MAIPVLKVSFGSIMRIYRDLTGKTHFTHADAIISFNNAAEKLGISSIPVREGDEEYEEYEEEEEEEEEHEVPQTRADASTVTENTDEAAHPEEETQVATDSPEPEAEQPPCE